MRSWRSSVVEDCATDQVRSVAPMPMAQPGLLYLVTAHDVQGLRSALAQGRLPADLETKLARLGATAICVAPGLGHPGIRDQQRSEDSRNGVTHCKHRGTGVGDRFCTPIWGESEVLGLKFEV